MKKQLGHNTAVNNSKVSLVIGASSYKYQMHFVYYQTIMISGKEVNLLRETLGELFEASVASMRVDQNCLFSSTMAR